jgi:uncharacterized damage-inducible protein DinB
MTDALANELQRLVDHSLWANREWIDFVYAQSDAETRPRELLGHIVVGERIWFDRVTNEQQTHPSFPLLDKEELVRDLEANRQTYLALIAGRGEEVIHFRRASGVEYQARVLDVIHHLLTHGYHHRGQLAAHYARKGVAFPNTDHINYLVMNRL